MFEMFGNVAISVLAFLVALGLLVSIHEFGHFWVARRVGIKVLRYSVGFGRAVWTRVGKVDQTEFVVAAIPLGGYVKMLDERESPVASDEQHRAFNRQPLWARAAVVIAGPLANLILAFIAYWFVMMIGISGIAPIIGDVPEGSPAARAGLESKDKIISVNGKTTPSWQDARLALLDASLDPNSDVKIRVKTSSDREIEKSLSTAGVNVLKASGDPIESLGIMMWRPAVEPVVGLVTDDSAAAAAGILVGDRILAIDGNKITLWRELVNAVQPSAGVPLTFSIQRGTEQFDLPITPNSAERDGETVGLLGVGVAQTNSITAFDATRITVRYSPLQSIGKALDRTWDMTLFTLRMIGKLFTGQASLDNISGPITIAQAAGVTASVGIDHYINFIAMISISLAVLNLLPIPMLDGGHLLYFAIEAVTGKAVSERVQIFGQQLGLLLLGGLMFLAFYNDIGRFMQ
ncbi:MAG: RIP metalloprotease RseP [Granulosicoccaceae bacterium]